MLAGTSPLQWVLAVILVLYIFSSAGVPPAVATAVDTSVGTLVVIVVAIAVFLNSNAVVGILVLVAGYELLRRSRRGHPFKGMGAHPHTPSEKKKVMDFRKYNDFPPTLEEDMVHKMAPLVKHAPAPGVKYQPTLHPQHSAAPIHYKGVL
jgi:uncharacterized membrane protein